MGEKIIYPLSFSHLSFADDPIYFFQCMAEENLKPDIQNRADIERLVDHFYQQVKKDELIGPIFTEVVPLVWEIHMPIMYEFWETVLFQGNYRGRPIPKHIALDKKFPLQEVHFTRWKALFFESLDSMFAGPVAEKARNKVQLMEKIIWTKVQASRQKGFIQ
ncbi:MAG: group III truncated hemoglobin [Bacteroidota bacterium]